MNHLTILIDNYKKTLINNPNIKIYTNFYDIDILIPPVIEEIKTLNSV